MHDIDSWCQGPCMNANRRKVRTYQQALDTHNAEWERWHAPRTLPEPPAEPRLAYPTYGEPVYCSTCAYGIKAQLSQLDGLACVYLRECDGMRGASSEPRVSGSAEPPSPSPALDVLDELDDWLRSWRADYLKVDHFARQGPLVDSLTYGCAWLTARAELILTRADVAKPFGDEATAWHSRLAGTARIEPRRVPKALRCPQCHLATLSQLEGEDRVECRNTGCGETRGGPMVMTLAEYEGYVADSLVAAKVTRRAS
ncbi:hypothetical protein [Streptosporangium jomthongense]|uniref:Uncharacterized protein n=1 Tax=Streptosporangium jomthongense TaxID=1193683 RepID=A0ABV8FCP3_9ACTN